jgi:hypothetical protein
VDSREKIEQLRIQLELAISSQNQKLSSGSIVALSERLNELIVEEINGVLKNLTIDFAQERLPR